MRQKSIFEKIIADNVPELIKMNSRISPMQNKKKKKTAPRHSIVKL